MLHRYGGHYKINGPPVNVPATLDQIAKILLHMPGELQLHPFKLKQKLEYKSHYMYDMVRRDKVIGAIMWLKEHNKHYESVLIDTTWLENEGDNYVPVLPCQGSGKDMCNSMPHIGTTSDNDVPVIPYQDSSEDMLHSSPHMPGCEPPNNTPNTAITMQPDVRVEPGVSVCSPDENREYGGTCSSDQIGNCMLEEENNELIEDQAEINRRQETTGYPLPSVVQFDNLKNVIFNLKNLHSQIYSHLAVADIIQEKVSVIYQSGNISSNAF